MQNFTAKKLKEKGAGELLDSLCDAFPRIKQDIFSYSELTKIYFEGHLPTLKRVTSLLITRAKKVPSVRTIEQLIKGFEKAQKQRFKSGGDVGNYSKLAERLSLQRKYIKPGVYVWERPFNSQKEKSESECVTDANVF